MTCSDTIEGQARLSSSAGARNCYTSGAMSSGRGSRFGSAGGLHLQYCGIQARDEHTGEDGRALNDSRGFTRARQRCMSALFTYLWAVYLFAQIEQHQQTQSVSKAVTLTVARHFASDLVQCLERYLALDRPLLAESSNFITSSRRSIRGCDAFFMTNLESRL
jgi:hypothetical protein